MNLILVDKRLKVIEIGLIGKSMSLLFLSILKVIGWIFPAFRCQRLVKMTLFVFILAQCFKMLNFPMNRTDANSGVSGIKR